MAWELSEPLIKGEDDVCVCEMNFKKRAFLPTVCYDELNKQSH